MKSVLSPTIANIPRLQIAAILMLLQKSGRRVKPQEEKSHTFAETSALNGTVCSWRTYQHFSKVFYCRIYVDVYFALLSSSYVIENIS